MGAMSDHPRRGVVIAVSGPSGVGKGTVIARLQQIDPEILHSVSVTTRAMRGGEKEGVDYYFRTREQFVEMLDRNEILEHDLYCGSYYGTPKAAVVEALEAGRDVVMDITVPGSLCVLDRFPEAVGVFLLPPTFTELRRRLLGRGTEDPAVIEKRLAKAVEEIGHTSKFEYVIVNEEVDRTARAILSILEAERCRYRRIAGIEDRILKL
jgi:guanylate kinase